MPERWSGDRVRISLENEGRVTNVEVNGVEIKSAAKLQLTVDGIDRRSRLIIELVPEVVEIEGEVALLELTRPQRLFIPPVLEPVASAG